MSDMNASEDEGVYYDSEFNLSDDDFLYDDYVDPYVEFGGSNKGKSVEGSEWCGDDVYAIAPAKNIEEEGCVHSDDDFASTYGSDDEENMKYQMYNPRAENKNRDLKLGLIFSSKEEAKFAIQSHCLRRGMMMKFEKNDKQRLRVVCKKQGCTRFVYASKMQNDNAWQIKSYNSEHNNCSWIYNNSSLKSEWIGKTFMKKFKDNPKLGTSELRNELCTTLKANVSKWQAYRAKKKAMDLMQGKMEEQFNKIWDYCEEIMRSNPSSTVRMQLIDDEGGERKWFQRFYMCFNACKMGFTNGCMPVVVVDGCFLKGRHGGQLLSVVGLDANNNIYPIAYAIV